MKTRKFIEKNTEHIAVYVIVFIFTALYLWRLMTWIRHGEQSGSEWSILLALGLIIGIFSWFILHLKMQLSVGNEKLTIRMNDGIHPEVSIKWKNVKKIEPFKIPESQMWSGMHMNFDHNVTQYKLGDNCGIKITMNDDKVYLIYSDKLYDMRGKVAELVKGSD